jgi:hypothetical protein
MRSAWLGQSICGSVLQMNRVGDVSGDGVEDLFVGIPCASSFGIPFAGAGLVLSGADLSTLLAFRGSRADDELGGCAVTHALRDDAIRLLIGGARSLTRVILTANRVERSETLSLDRGDARPRRDYAPPADCDGDGSMDLIVVESEIGADDVTTVRVRVISGETLADIGTLTGEGRFPSLDPDTTLLRNAICGLQDLDGDSADELVVGTRCYDLSMGSFGYLQAAVASLRTLEVRFTTERYFHAAPDPYTPFLWGVASAGDADGDGFADVLIAPESFEFGQVFLFSGKSGRRLYDVQVRDSR